MYFCVLILVVRVGVGGVGIGLLAGVGLSECGRSAFGQTVGGGGWPAAGRLSFTYVREESESANSICISGGCGETQQIYVNDTVMMMMRMSF